MSKGEYFLTILCAIVLSGFLFFLPFSLEMFFDTYTTLHWFEFLLLCLSIGVFLGLSIASCDFDYTLFNLISYFIAISFLVINIIYVFELGFNLLYVIGISCFIVAFILCLAIGVRASFDDIDVVNWISLVLFSIIFAVRWIHFIVHFKLAALFTGPQRTGMVIVTLFLAFGYGVGSYFLSID